MKKPKLTWFRLRFPRELDEDAVLAALASFSGLPHGTRLVLKVSATSEGITHSLGVTPKAWQAVAGNLRAAIPSLRITPSPIPDASARRLLWQLTPRLGVLRSDELGAVSAALLSSLFPLGNGEAISLSWRLRPAPRPPLPPPQDPPNHNRQKALRDKLAEPGTAAFGELMVDAEDEGRRLALVQRISTTLRSLGAPYGRLVAEPAWYGTALRWLGLRGRYMSAPELAAVIGWPIGGPDLPGLELGAAKRLVPSAALGDKGRTLGSSDFPGIDRKVAISSKASTRGLYVLGPTGTGKTSLLKNLIADDLEQGRGLVVIETNGDLINDLVDAIPEKRIKDVVLLDATDRQCAVGFNPFVGSSDPALIADQLGELFHRLWEAFWGPRTAQLTHMGLLTLARREGSTLLDLPRLYMDPDFRDRVLDDLDDPLGLGPDWNWFESLSRTEKANVISPLLNKVRQFTARPSIRAIVGQSEPRLGMRQIIEGKKVLLVHLPKGLIGAETAQLLGCLVLTALWQAAAERAALPPGRRHPFGLYVDEVQDFAASPVPWDELFAQGRKYGVSLTVAHQNLEQLPKELREIVLANARSKVAFALSASDARVMERVFAPAMSAADLQALDPYGVVAQVALDDGSTARPVTLLTPPPRPPLGSADAVRASSRQLYSRPRRQVEAELRAQVRKPRPAAPVGRRLRSES